MSQQLWMTNWWLPEVREDTGAIEEEFIRRMQESSPQWKIQHLWMMPWGYIHSAVTRLLGRDSAHDPAQNRCTGTGPKSDLLNHLACSPNLQGFGATFLLQASPICLLHLLFAWTVCQKRKTTSIPCDPRALNKHKNFLWDSFIGSAPKLCVTKYWSSWNI